MIVERLPTKILLATTFLSLWLALPVLGQSGRRQETDKSKKPLPSPVAEPRRSVASEKKSKNPSKSNDADSDDVVRISSNLVPIPVSVIDAQGFSIGNLKLDDFELRVDGEVRTVSDLTRSETPVRLAMLFDNSGSLDFARDFEKQAAMRFFKKVMRAKDQAAIYSIATESYLAQPLTSDVVLLEQTIAGFGKPEGGTSLFDAILDSAGYLRPFTARRVLVIVSDGIETTSRTNDFELVMHHVVADDCQIYVVQTGLYDGANVRALAAERRMETLTRETGGAVYLPRTVSELDQAFDQIAADLAQQYVLSYYPGAELRDGRLHTIDLKVKTRNDVRVRSRRGYYSPKSNGSAQG